MHTTHTDYMSLALELAARGRTTVSPNPMVGCVIVKDNVIIGQGYHVRAGEPHAEVYALREADQQARGATMYVTLEPCCHTGKTPPCVDAVIQAGIKKVYIAVLDPNPLVAGKGKLALEQAGIDVQLGLGGAEACALNAVFFHYIQQRRPYVIAKWAMSLDGKTMTAANDDRDISNAKSKVITHELREQVDAVLIGANTAKQDNPQLTVRLEKEIAKQPLRIILSTNGDLPLNLTVFSANLPGKTMVVTSHDAPERWCRELIANNISVLKIKKNKNQQLDLSDLLSELGKLSITSLLVEGGMTIHASFIQENLVNRYHVYVAPILIGDLNKKQKLQTMQLKQVDDDLHVIANNREY